MRVWSVAALNLVGIETTLHKNEVEAYQQLVRNIGAFAGDRQYKAEAEMLEVELASGVTEDLTRRINTLAQRSGVKYEVKQHSHEWISSPALELLETAR